ncbi:hypothetical protein [Hymenobacter algoricola]|uniref:Uncharacterized protein n=1 Tax=Hymenobacter algoricola TaxID=486267 RepID=A0ABP7MNU0_9BACT
MERFAQLRYDHRAWLKLRELSGLSSADVALQQALHYPGRWWTGGYHFVISI